jgi:hypothetical protein
MSVLYKFLYRVQKKIKDYIFHFDSFNNLLSLRRELRSTSQ